MTAHWNGRGRFDEGKAAEILSKHVSRASNNKMTLTEQRTPLTLQGNNILTQDIVYASLQVLVLEELAMIIIPAVYCGPRFLIN
jgi:hypothetical protein